MSDSSASDALGSLSSVADAVGGATSELNQPESPGTDKTLDVGFDR